MNWVCEKTVGLAHEIIKRNVDVRLIALDMDALIVSVKCKREFEEANLFKYMLTRNQLSQLRCISATTLEEY